MVCTLCSRNMMAVVTLPPPPPQLCNKVALTLCHLLLSWSWKKWRGFQIQPNHSDECVSFLVFIINWAASRTFCFLALEYAGSWGRMWSYNSSQMKDEKKMVFRDTNIPFLNSISSGFLKWTVLIVYTMYWVLNAVTFNAKHLDNVLATT